ncbi:MAG: hypothetical protein GXP62_02670 [Oligoflexia bacterium]|nr:hypothetical protein [Oligoflexia bacterium]
MPRSSYRPSPALLAPLLAPLLVSVISSCSNSKNGLSIYNTPPNVTISNPPSGSAFDEYQTVTFTARVGDDQDLPEDLLVSWTSSIEGALPDGPVPDADGLLVYSTANLSPGNHVITLQAIDTQAEAGSFDVTVTINDLPEAPTVTVLRPATGEDGAEDQEFDFKVAVSDSKDAPEDLTVTFESDVDGTFCTPEVTLDGQAECSQALSAGDHMLTFRATDLDGEVGTATTYFVVVPLEEQDNDGDGWTELQGDCDDTNANIHPGATETANGIDDDCDDVIDNNTDNFDDDGDGWSEAEGDCNDADATIYPDAPETYNGSDDNCNDIVDEGTVGYDDDGDGWTEVDGDCNDDYALAYPGGTEIEDGYDNDCNGLIDDGTDAYDDDGDGYTEHGGDCDDTNPDINPGATEVCGDGVDNNCNSSADEAGASGCTTYYRDYDSDAYGDSAYSDCLCSVSGYYTTTYNNDCYDYNANANPAASSYYTTSRGDGSYDYNCDGVESKYYSTTATCSFGLSGCDVSTSGWDGSIPSCGNTGAYASTSDADGCTLNWLSCEVTGTITYTQKCR